MPKKKRVLVLENIRTLPMWNLLKKLVKEQEHNEYLPIVLHKLFWTTNPQVLIGYTKSRNPALAALARSRIVYEGQELGMRC